MPLTSDHEEESRVIVIHVSLNDSDMSKERGWVAVKPRELEGEFVSRPYEQILKRLLSSENKARIG